METADLLKPSGGFRVVVGGDVLAAKRDLAAFDGSARRRRSAWLALGCAMSGVLFALELIHQCKMGSTYSSSRLLNLTVSAISLLATGFPLGIVLSILFPRSSSLRVDREQVEIGRKSKKLKLPKDDVKQISFVDEGLSWLGFPCHILIKTLGRKIPCLQGINAEEAAQIITECRRLGYNSAASAS